jgi:hypothetical protein
MKCSRCGHLLSGSSCPNCGQSSSLFSPGVKIVVLIVVAMIAIGVMDALRTAIVREGYVDQGVAMVVLLAVMVILVGGPIVIVLMWKKMRAAEERAAKVGPIIDAATHLSDLQAKAAAASASATDANLRLTQTEQAIDVLRRDIAARRLAADAEITAQRAQAAAEIRAKQEEAHRVLADIEARLQQHEPEIALHDVGFYEPRFHFGTAIEYKAKLDEIEAKQAELIRAGNAARCDQQWTIDGSKREGKKITDRILKLMLRAFNGESDALIAKVRYDNRAAYTERIRRSFETINRLGEGFYCYITTEYLDLKIAELDLTHAYQEQLQEEREEQRQIRAQMAEEEKRAKELARQQKTAEEEERRYEMLLRQARRDAETAVDAQRQDLLAQIASLEQNLQQAHDRMERAKSQAQLTRSGHVYVLSNIGSFGDEVFKVGMTRRLDPQERVDELGDASVPFPFDVHAMIYTDDAPRLEKALHSLFDTKRINKVNTRKEFFRASLEEIEAVVRQHHGEFRLTKQAEAIEYRKTIALLSASGPAIPVGSAAVLVTDVGSTSPDRPS